jgi:hypothetical protein
MFSTLPKGTRSEIEAEAGALAPHRGCTADDLAFKKSL